jgi:hypothetical protein
MRHSRSWKPEPVREQLVPALAGERTVSEATPPFDWELYNDRQDACREADRIAAACTQGHCDELALRTAQRACSPFTAPAERRWPPQG